MTESTGGRRAAARTLAVLLAGLLPLAALVVVIFWVHMDRCERYLAQHRYRSLAAFCTQIAGVVEGTQERMRTQGRRARAASSTACEGRDAPLLEEIEVRFLVGPTDPKPRIELRYPACERPLDQDGAPAAAPRASATEKDCSGPEGCTRDVDLRKLIDESTSREDFDALLLIDQDGRVRRQVGLDAGGVANVWSLPREAPAKSDGKGSDQKGASDGKSSEPGQDGAKASGRSPGQYRAENVQLYGEPYQLFCQPLDSLERYRRTDRAPPVSQLSVCGLVRWSRVSAERMAIPWQLAFTLGFGLVAAVLAIPMLRLGSLGPRERLRSLDVKTLVLCGMLGAALVTVVTRVLSLSLGRSARLDYRLESFANTVRDRLREEVRSGLKAVESVQPVDVQEARKAPAVESDAKRVGTGPEVFLFGEDGVSIGRLQRGAASGTSYVSDIGFNVSYFAYFRETLWRESPPHRWTTPLEKAGCQWASDEPGCDRVAVQVIPSLIDGKPRLAVARKMDSEKIVAAARVMLEQFQEPLVSRYFGFAVVEPSGRVVLHSQPGRSLAEDLVLETDETPSLKAALFYGRQGFFDVQYLGRPHRLYVSPIPSSRWSVVAFRDTQLTEAAGAETLAASATLFLAYFLPFVVIAVVLQIVRPDHRAAWLWPDRRRVGATGYALAAAAVVVTALWVIVTVRGGGMPALAQLLALPMATLAALYLALGPRDRRTTYLAGAVAAGAGSWLACWSWVAVGPWALCWAAVTLLWVVLAWRSRSVDERRFWSEGEETRFRLGYVGMLAALLVVVAIVPAYVFSGDGDRQTTQEVLRLDESHLLGKKAYLDPGKVLETANIKLGSVVTTVLGVSARAAPAEPGAAPNGPLELHAWDQISEDHPSGGTDGGAPNGLSAYVLSYLPAYTPLIADLRAMDGSAALVRKHPNAVPRVERDGHAALERAHGLEARSLLSLVVLVALLLGFWALWAIVRSVFLLDADVPAEGSFPDDGAPPRLLPRWRFHKPATKPSPEGTTPPALDLSRDGSASGIGSWKDRHAQAAAAVEIDHLESCLDDPDAVLSLLEALARRDEVAITVHSLVDPVERLAATIDEAEEAGLDADPKAAARKARWQALLADFQIGRDTAAPTSDASAAWRTAWAQSTDGERLALCQLLKEGFLNPQSARVARALFARGLLRRDRDIELPDQLRPTVHEVLPETVARWEHGGTPGTWSRLRVPLGVVVIAATLFLVYTQHELLTSAVGVLTAVTAAVPLFLRLLGRAGEESAGRGRS